MTARQKMVAVLQPGYLPWLGFFDQMRRVDTFVLYDDVQYDKHGWRNRNRIKGPGGPLWLTVPVRHSGLGWPRIDEVAIDTTQRWARKHTASIAQNYARAPYLSTYLPPLEELLTRPWERLADLDVALMQLMASWLKVDTAVVKASALGIDGQRTARLLDICRLLGAGRYLSGDAARDYLDEASFTAAGIEVVWQQYRHPVYSQLHGAFVSHLSAIDALMNCGPAAAGFLGTN